MIFKYRKVMTYLLVYIATNNTTKTSITIVFRNQDIHYQERINMNESIFMLFEQYHIKY